MYDYDDLWEFDIPFHPKLWKNYSKKNEKKKTKSTIYKMESELHKKKDWIEQDIEHLNEAKEHYLNIFGWWTPMDRKHYKSIVDKIPISKKEIGKN